MSKQLARRVVRRRGRKVVQPEGTPDLIRKAGATRPVERRVLALQAEQGNRHIQRLVAAAVQREATAEAPSAAVPGLPAVVVREIERNIETDRPIALATILGALASANQIEPAFLQDGTMTYVSDTSRMRPGHSGLTSLTPGTERPRPCRVEIGPDAFRSVSTLYTTVLHEWQHVLQFRRPDQRGVPADELEARLWEIENLESTGLWRNASYMGLIRGQLDHWWRELASEEQAPLRSRYEAAIATIAEMRLRLQDEQFAQQRGGR